MILREQNLGQSAIPFFCIWLVMFYITYFSKSNVKTKKNDTMSDNSSENGSADSQTDYISPDASLQKSFLKNVNLKSPTQDPNLNITKRLDFDSDIERL